MNPEIFIATYILNKTKKMGFSKVLILSLISLLTILSHNTLAQNSPEDFVAAHNKVRTPLNLPQVEWNATLTAYAQNYADIRSADCAMQHSEGPYGENLAAAAWDLSAAEAVKIWADEEKFYDYSSNSCIDGEMCGHYTQVVWRDSSNIGCARAKCRNNDWTFVTCNYYAPGNYIGQRPY